MAKIITLKYRGSTFFGDPKTAFTEAMQQLAEYFKIHHQQADFAIIDSYRISDICLSSMNFFDKYVEEIFRQNGLDNIEVHGLCGGVYDYVITRIKQENSRDEAIEYLDAIRFASEPVLYKLTRIK